MDDDELKKRVNEDVAEHLEAATQRTITERLSSPRPDKLTEDRDGYKLVGYWNTDHSPDWLPDPTPTRDWDPELKKIVLAHLRAGDVLHRWRGWHDCLLCEGHVSTGTTCMTDGVWQWPEGLAHYLAKHDVELPQEFIDHVWKNGRDG